MPSIIKKESVAGGGTYYPLQGSQYEYLPWDARLEFAIVASAAGAVMNIFSGSDILVQNGDVPIKTTAIVYPDDFLISDVAAAGERISVEVSVSGLADEASIGVRSVARLTPV